MITQARAIRAIADALPGAPKPTTPAQLDRQDYILEAGRQTMLQFGRETVTMPQFSVGIRLTPAQIRWYFPDLDCLFAAILRRHLNAISKAINDSVPYANDPDCHSAARAAYYSVTRTALGTFNKMHQLFLNDRHKLPKDQAEDIDILYDNLARLLGEGELGWHALDLLNTDGMKLSAIEDNMAALEGIAPKPHPTPVVIEAVPTEPHKVPQFPRHIRRKIEALRRAQQKQEEK
jgi:AcrR family transcriptional regulator